jgi:3'-phosphoadenosine 5'-phosphosulfate sulfotransferase (PAPS reductase)/FAD synthetase
VNNLTNSLTELYDTLNNKIINAINLFNQHEDNISVKPDVHVILQVMLHIYNKSNSIYFFKPVLCPVLFIFTDTKYLFAT